MGRIKPIQIVEIDKYGDTVRITTIQGKKRGTTNINPIFCELRGLERFMCFAFADLPEALRHLGDFLLNHTVANAHLSTLSWVIRVLEAWPWGELPRFKWHGFSREEQRYYTAAVMMVENALEEPTHD